MSEDLFFFQIGFIPNKCVNLPILSFSNLLALLFKLIQQILPDGQYLMQLSVSNIAWVSYLVKTFSHQQLI
jgi:hypothetical protein